MSILPRLAGALGRKDEAPNKELGRELVEARDVDGIREVAENLWDEDRRVQTDCLAVLEQVGLLAPELIEGYVADFLKLITSKVNRVVWASMIDLALIADRKPDEIFGRYNDVVRAIEKGSVITKDNGIKVLSRVAATGDEYRRLITPYLMGQLETCRAKSVAQYAESIRVAIAPDNQAQYLGILNARLDDLSAAQQKRVKKLLRAF